jgi:uncharacterized protein
MTMTSQLTTPVLAVDVRDLLRHPGAYKRAVISRPLPHLATPVAEVDPASPVTFDGMVESVVEGLLVTGTVTATARLQCVRCLRDRFEDLTVEVRELFALSPREAEEEGYAVLPDHRLPLDTMVRDAIVLAFPSAPLCREDCAGLCPVCGTDRNQADCGHRRPVTDPRWEALSALRRQLEEEQDARPET